MPQAIAWQCLQAQTQLAHLTNTLPANNNYDDLMAEIEKKMKVSKMTPPNIHECLRKRGVYLTDVDSAPFGSNPSTSNGDGPSPVVVFLCDVDGTTTPLPFARQVMLPLATAYVETYTKAHFPSDATFVQHIAAAAAYAVAKSIDRAGESLTDPALAEALRDALAKSEAAQFADEDANTAVRNLFCQHFRQEVKKGSNESYMKAVQGSIWEEVYAQGQHQTQVFPDVNEFFRYAGSKHNGGALRIAIFSSGSVATQKTVMQHTPYGDLNPFITAYFDPTMVGTKLTPKSYMRIRNLLAKQLDIFPQENLQIVFLTDSTSEASAADSSGAVDCPVLCIRPLNTWITIDTLLSVGVPFITSFTQLMRPNEKVDYNRLVKDTVAALKDKPV